MFSCGKTASFRHINHDNTERNGGRPALRDAFRIRQDTRPSDDFMAAFTFIDLFAGAGGFSEGFLQAGGKDRYFDFLLASDINPTCELTHRMRYNRQLGLGTGFLTKDITDPDYIDELESLLAGRTVDVVVGGPPCQSFSLAGVRRTNDKKDDLFSYYLKVIRRLRPKYFVMESVCGILTKYDGRVRERILREIRDIVDMEALREYTVFTENIAYDYVSGDELAEAVYCVEKLKIVSDGMVSFRESMTPMLRGISRNVYLERGDEIVLRMTQE